MQKGVCQSTLSRYTLVHHTVATITDWLRGDYGNGEHELDGLSGASADTKGLLDGILPTWILAGGKFHRAWTVWVIRLLCMNFAWSTDIMPRFVQAHRFKTETKGTWRDVILALIPCYWKKTSLFVSCPGFMQSGDLTMFWLRLCSRILSALW